MSVWSNAGKAADTHVANSIWNNDQRVPVANRWEMGARIGSAVPRLMQT